MGRGLNIVSWNVASWKTTVQQLDSRHASASERGLDAWLRSLGADVLCLQEVKLMSKDLYQDPKGLGTAPGGYETFWACNDGKGAQTRGLNGVGAYVRAGLVVRSSCVALGESDLNDEGRCLLLELRGGLVIVSVYVPNDGSSSSRVRYKLRFLDALVALLARERAAGKTVVLLGDLNLKTRPADNYWSHRRLDLAAIASAHHAGTLDQASLGLPAQPSWQTDERVAEEYAQLNTRALSLARALGEGLEAMQSALAKAEVRPHKTKNPANGECFDKFKLFVPVGCSDNGKEGSEAWRAVGSAEETEAEARSGYNLTGCTISATGE
ncbi:Endonuclease/exonuclease/phosphatase [Pavlovales sp. CCMP2436]|nr:Endonuclease/exonuclease/phosphatase [Pavlovales sp. CCMP2436]